jgi:hypothetical protein
MRRWVIVICLGLCLTAGFCCWLALRPENLSLVLSKQMRRGPGATVDLAEVAPFAWDRVYVFGPYTPHDYIDTCLGFHWGEVESTTIDMHEGVNLVVFVRDAEVVHWFEHPRNEELEDLADPNGYAREQAKFKVERVGADQRLGLVPPKR